MNERIQELKIQASKEVWGTNPYTGAPQFDELELDAEKFAELIVRECARVYWNIDDSETHTEYVEALKQHFGIKE